MLLRREFYRNRHNPIRRNAMPIQMAYEHPNEWLIYSIDTKTVGEPYLTCPHCGRRVQKLFTLAHDDGGREAHIRFSENKPDEVMCGYDTATLLADTDAIVLGKIKNLRMNPAFKPMTFAPPKFTAPKVKVDPEAHLPWRMFSEYASHICKRCGGKRPATFVVAKSRASADKVFEKGNGLCPTCMCRVLLAPRERIRMLDEGLPNPPVTRGTERTKPLGIASPYRLFGFTAKKPRKCGCGKERWQYYVIATDIQTAQKRVDRYGMCALCMCELLCLDRYAIETADGGPP